MRADVANALLISADLRIPVAGTDRPRTAETGDATGRCAAAEARRSAEMRVDAAPFTLISADLRIPSVGWGPTFRSAVGWGPTFRGAVGWGPTVRDTAGWGPAVVWVTGVVAAVVGLVVEAKPRIARRRAVASMLRPPR